VFYKIVVLAFLRLIIHSGPKRIRYQIVK